MPWLEKRMLRFLSIVFFLFLAAKLYALSTEDIMQILRELRLPQLSVIIGENDIIFDRERNLENMNFEEALKTALKNLLTLGDKACLVDRVAEFHHNLATEYKVMEILNNSNTALRLLNSSTGQKSIAQDTFKNNWVFFLEVDRSLLDFDFVIIVNNKCSYNYSIKTSQQDS
jgi:hypothetical protein